MHYPFSAALGRTFFGIYDLAYVHVPDGISKEEALAMVEAANAATAFQPPYAFLVCEQPDRAASDHRREVSVKGSIQYREGRHVAVVYGRKPDLPSFHNTFQEIVGQSFPDAASGAVSLRRLSEVVADDLLRPFELSRQDPHVVDIIESCLEQVRDLYIDGHSDIRSWNSVWFRHGNVSLRNLSALLEKAQHQKSGMTPREFFELYAYAAFGLPKPARLWKERRSQARDARVLNDARDEYWNVAESIENSIRILSFGGRVDEASLLGITWSEFDAIAADSPNAWLALAEFLAADLARIEAFATLDERDFLNPGGEAQSNVLLTLEDSQRVNLALEPEKAGSPVLVPMTGSSELHKAYSSDELSLVIPLARDIESIPLTGREVKIALSPASQAEWFTDQMNSVGNELFVRGRIRWKSGTGRNAARFRELRMTTSFLSGTAASPHLPLKAQTLNVLSFDSQGDFLALAPKKAKGAIGRARVRGFWGDANDVAEPTVDLKPSPNGFHALVWSAEGEIAYFDRTQIQRHPTWKNLSLAHFVPTGSHAFASGKCLYRVNSVEVQAGQQSALLAAALKEHVTPNRPSSPTVDSVRGQYEAYAGEQLTVTDSPDFLNALGHVAFPADLQATMTDGRPQDGGAILMDANARRALQRQDFVSFDHPEFVFGPAAERFRNAAQGLGISQRLSAKENEDGVTFEWPSRTSWRSIWQGDALSEYLEAYAQLVESAKETGEAGLIFWATYPFSISIWDVENGTGCCGVLMSPLHPIRLAWLAGVEDVLAAASDPLDFLGSIEGWNFPTAGPGSGTGHRLLAVPCDSGEGQIFATWGMLVRSSTSDPIPLSSPASIGSYNAPGTAVSGLNASAVDAALRSFRKMHPHVTTLTVDLSGQKAQPRLTEIDSAVLKMAVKWKEAGVDGLLGGIRVLDSVNRLGNPPRAELTRLVRDNPDLLFTWSRYNPRKVLERACSVRFLQDSGSVITAGNGQTANGILGQVPLRRFEVNDGLLSASHLNNSYPGIDLRWGWQPFTRALTAIENYPVVSSGISRGSLSDRSANWTVMGETYLSPSTIASLMSDEHSGDRMLWEWRPPVLDEGPSRVLMEKRPFVSVARVPRAFSRELDKLLQKARPVENIDDLRRSVLTTLGTRGVGLSSLLAMGGTQVAGAIGFYLALSLLDQARCSSTNRLIIPIDAADYFLRILADGASHAGFQRRADLLILDLSDSGLTMTPVEIKAYGLQSRKAGNKLPEPTSPDLVPALDQLKDSHELLSKIEGLSKILEGADARLWWNSLATLVEVAAKLSPQTLGSVGDFASRMSRLVNGELPVKVGRPLLTYFLHNARDENGAKYYIGSVGAPDAGAVGLVCDVETAFEAIRESDGAAFISDWQSLVDLSMIDTGASAEDSHAYAEREGATSAAVEHKNDDPASSGGEAMNDDRKESEGGPAHPLEESARAVVPHGEGAESREAEDELTPGGAPGPDSTPTWGIKGQGVRINVGTVIDSVGNAPADFWPSNTALNQPNIGIVGDLGTGKTELIKALIAQIREQTKTVQPGVPTSMLIFDYKGDFQQEEFLSRVGGLVLDPHRIPLNIFLPVTDDYSRKPYQQGAALVDTFKRIYSGIGPRQMSFLNQAVRESFDGKNVPPTLSEVRDHYLQLCPDPDSVSAILDTFVFGEIFSSTQEGLQSFDDLLEGQVVVLALNKLGQDSNTKNSLVALFLNLYHDYMLRGGILPFVEGTPTLRHLKSFLLVDEAVNIMRYDFQVLEDIMLKGRGAGIGVMLATQYLSHFRAGRTNYVEPLRTWFIHKVPSVTAKELAALGIADVTDEVVRRVPRLGNHQVLYKSFGFDQGRFVRVTPYYELVRE